MTIRLFTPNDHSRNEGRAGNLDERHGRLHDHLGGTESDDRTRHEFALLRQLVVVLVLEFPHVLAEDRAVDVVVVIVVATTRLLLRPRRRGGCAQRRSGENQQSDQG
jgi:hypothetical protein